MNDSPKNKPSRWAMWAPRLAAVAFAIPAATITLGFCFLLAMSGLPLVGLLTFPLGSAALAASAGAALSWSPARPLGYAFASLFGYASGWLVGVLIFFAFDHSPVVDRCPIYALPLGWAVLGTFVSITIILTRRNRTSPKSGLRQFCPPLAATLSTALALFMIVHSYRVVTFEIPQAGSKIAAFTAAGKTTCLATSPTETVFAIGGLTSDHGFVQLVTTAGLTTLDWKLPLPVRDLAFSPTRPILAVAARGNSLGSIHLWDLETSKPLRQVALGHEPISLEFSPDGRYLKVLAWDTAAQMAVLTLWNTESWTSCFVLQTEAGLIDGNNAWDGAVDGSLARKAEHSSVMIAKNATTFSPDCCSIAVAKTSMGWTSLDQLEIWTTERQLIHSASLPVQELSFVRYLPSGTLLLAGTPVAEYDPATATLRNVPRSSAPLVELPFSLGRWFRKPEVARYWSSRQCLAVSSDAQILISAGARIVGGDGFPNYANAMLWNIDTGDFLGEILYEEVHTCAHAVAISPDKKTLILVLANPPFSHDIPSRIELFDVTTTTNR